MLKSELCTAGRKKILLSVLASLVLFGIFGCAAVSRTRSGPGNTEAITMTKLTVRPGSIMSMELYWDATMPKNTSLAIVYLRGDYKPAKNTSVNMRLGREKYAFQPIDMDMQSNIKNREILRRYRISKYSEDELMLAFYLPDSVLKKIADNNNHFFIMINLANDMSIEQEPNYYSIGMDMRSFYKCKYPNS